MKLTGNNLIIVNILATYVRILFVAGLGLFSTRWVLQALGKEDFGLYSVVGGLIVFILFIGSTMAGSVQRFYAYAIGQGDQEEVKKWFNCAFVLHSGFSVILVLVGIPLGNYFLCHVMQIPPERLETCRWIYYFSVVGAVGAIMTTPYLAMYYAKQRIFELSMWSALQVLLMFVLAFFLQKTSGNLLLIYAFGMVAIKLVMDGIQIIRALSLFCECRTQTAFWLEGRRIIELSVFTGWKLFAGFGVVLKNQGLSVLVNIFSGPKVNAALGVANQVGAQCYGMSTTILQALSPEIIGREGAGERSRMISMSLRASKFTTFLTFLWLFPLCGNMEYVLELWLSDVPPHTAALCRIVLIAHGVETLSVGYGCAIEAQGRIKGFTISQGLIVASVFPLAWGIYSLGGSVELASSSLILMSVIVTYTRVYWVKRLLHVSEVIWFKKVLIPSLLVGIGPAIICVVFLFFYKICFINFITSSFFIITFTINLIWYFGINVEERKFFIQKMRNVLRIVR